MSYFLKKTRNKKGLYLQIYSGSMSRERGHVVQSCYRSLGYYDDLVAGGISDPVAHFQEEVDGLNAAEKMRKQADKGKKIGVKGPLRSIGYFPLKMILDGLDAERYLALWQGVRGFRFDLYETLSSLVFARVVAPCSKRATFHDVLPQLFNGPDISYDQILGCCEFIGSEYGRLTELFTALTDRKYGTRTGTTYFDCTNFYFEIDREDGFRRKGPSKEMRKDPIVGLGLLLDADMIPIGMKMYPGNQSEKPVLRQIVAELKEKNRIKGRTIHVADMGLNCAENIARARKDGDGYIFSKSVRQLPEKEKVWVTMDSEDWVDVISSDGSLHYRYKECIDRFPYSYTADGGKTVTVNLTEKRVLTWSPKLAEKKACEIRKMAEKAKALCYSEAKRSEFGDSGRYIDFRSSEDGRKAVASINQDAIDKDLELAGYNLLVTSETRMSARDIYSTYHSLWRIEESFRVMKSSLDARPVFLQKEDCIKGHFLICYIAVLLVRIFQVHILKGRFGTPEIMKFMRDFKVVQTGRGEYMNMSIASPFIDELSSSLGIPLNNLFLDSNALRKMGLKN